MTRDELRNALNKLLVDSCDLPSGEVVEELEEALMAAQEAERLEAVQYHPHF